jgi:hypothetical protein
LPESGFSIFLSIFMLSFEVQLVPVLLDDSKSSKARLVPCLVPGTKFSMRCPSTQCTHGISTKFTGVKRKKKGDFKSV